MLNDVTVPAVLHCLTLAVKLAQRIGVTVSLGALAISLVERWSAEYEAQNNNADLVNIELGEFTYTFDLSLDRVVCVVGHSSQTRAARDTSRQRGHPSHRPDDKGHFIAHSMGGGMDINLFAQSAGLNRRGGWRRFERIAAGNPGTFVAIRAIYEDGSSRPSMLDYGIDIPEEGFTIERFDNGIDASGLAPF